ncbi:Sensor_kinase_SpoOB-type, alpha-helical domain [Caminicella sporogenes DSM 14501]|uniref:histidine kinase n=1 Tax=Caminicella sporogenes DSM 14501 TaxID=1121266 RepID=A0A1M6QJS2_9FIRM|nr:GHKL domain-containing protein [Caminicella sporogenes]RKD25287.1 hypothetical protein BET04_03475 [Caminicella sporogenes]SHK20492.1 Sensor_kinase_SpoOB-type, alpha-helical domain [Caminicella sporogenes DSM 14501]
MENKKKYIIISTMLFQTLLIIIYNISILGSSTLVNLKKSIPFFNIFIGVTTILILISFKEINDYEKKEAELRLMKSNMKNVEELITLLRTQRHEYLSHIQAIGAMLYLEEYKELNKYLRGISTEYRFTNEIVRLGHPALTALINTKRELAKEQGIAFYIKCKHKINLENINSWDLCSLFSNLIENAIEAALASEGKKWIKIMIDKKYDKYIFKIENTGKIKDEIKDKIFEAGFTTQTSVGRGYGLYIVKKIVSKYEGTINFKNTDKGTVVFTISLPSEVNKYDKKVS